LHYLAKLVIRNDESLINVREDLTHVDEAKGVILKSLIDDMKTLKEELDKINKTVKAEADRLEETNNAVREVATDDLKEQRTVVRRNSEVPLYNQMQDITGRTSMERFTLSAAVAIEEAVDVCEDVKDKYEKLLGYFGEDTSMESDEFFGTMQQFITEFYSVAEQVVIAEKKEVRISYSIDSFLSTFGRFLHLICFALIHMT